MNIIGPPPIKNVNWGQTKEEVFEELGIQQNATERLGGGEANSVTYVLKDSLSFIGEHAQTSLSFDSQYGLAKITFCFEKENIITELIPKLQEQYSSETGVTQGSIYGSIPNELGNTQMQKYKEYLKKQGMDES